MNNKSLLIKPLTACLLTVAVGVAGRAIAAPGLSQLQPTETDLLMAQASRIEGSWRLVNMTLPSSPMPMLPTQSDELTADFAGDRVSGSGGCNRFSGGFEAQGGQLSIGPLASTFIACEEPISTQEARYLAGLQGAQRYEIDDQGGLQIFYQTEEGTGVLRFTSRAVRGLW